jgi:hypothetical protein
MAQSNRVMSGEFDIRNQELYDLYRYMDVITHITVGRLKWAGHLMMMSMG